MKRELRTTESGIVYIENVQPDPPPEPEPEHTGWACPACGVWFDASKGEHEEYTVGHIKLPGRIVNRHIICPSCGRCMACADKGSEE